MSDRSSIGPVPFPTDRKQDFESLGSQVVPEALTPSPSPKGRGELGALHYRGGRPFSALLDQARKLRQMQTPAEELLWQLLRGKRLANAKFRRQHQFGPYLVDFYCHEARLVVEVDGAPHRDPEQSEADRWRDSNLRAEGLTVLRFWNSEVLNDTERVLRTIADRVDVPPSPLGRGAGGEGS